jgi:hypothetical protein
VGYENFKVLEIAGLVKKAMATDVREIAVTASNDLRSYT